VKTPISFKDFCNQILDLDETIRFAGIADMQGKIATQSYREGMTPLLTKEESELSALQSIIRMGTRQTLEEKIGKTIYAFALYEKIKRATIPIYDNSDSILMVSFDKEAEHETIILKKILPLLARVYFTG
jgi:hypothetical protein